MKPIREITKHFNATLTKSFLLIFLSTLNYGLDNQGFNTSEAMSAFKKQFGHFDEVKQAYALETYWLSLFNSLIYIGFAAGVLLGSFVSARWGRRMCIFVMSCWALVAAAICVSSSTSDQILAGRVLFCRFLLLAAERACEC
jgi:MFS family permease